MCIFTEVLFIQYLLSGTYSYTGLQSYSIYTYQPVDFAILIRAAEVEHYGSWKK